MSMGIKITPSHNAALICEAYGDSTGKLIHLNKTSTIAAL